MTAVIKRYRMFIALVVINSVILLLGFDQGHIAFEAAAMNLKEMLLVLPPIFILMGLLDVWVKRETMIVWMGDKSGLKGMLLAFLLGSAAAGPLYAAFPITYMMAKKGVSVTNILVFLGAWSTLKIPMLLFEFSNLGIKFTLIRMLFNIVAIATLSWLVNRLMTEHDHRAFQEAIAKNDTLSV
jgi:uncharacterized membrane protein YraQ (UPF0718 family)